MKVNTHLLAPLFALIKADPHTYLFLTVTIDFITDLLESNRYNALYIVVDYDLIKAIVFILCTKTVTNLGTYTGPLFFSPHDSFHSSFLLYLFRLPHLSTPISQTHAY